MVWLPGFVHISIPTCCHFNLHTVFFAFGIYTKSWTKAVILFFTNFQSDLYLVHFVRYFETSGLCASSDSGWKKCIIFIFKVFTNKKIWFFNVPFLSFFQYLFIVELAKIRGNWMFWNVINCLLAFIWFPCFGITMFLENDWPLVMILTFFVIIGVNRSILSVGMWKLKVHEVNPRAVPEPGLQQQPVVMVKKNFL